MALVPAALCKPCCGLTGQFLALTTERQKFAPVDIEALMLLAGKWRTIIPSWAVMLLAQVVCMHGQPPPGSTPGVINGEDMTRVRVVEAWLDKADRRRRAGR